MGHTVRARVRATSVRLRGKGDYLRTLETILVFAVKQENEVQ